MTIMDFKESVLKNSTYVPILDLLKSDDRIAIIRYTVAVIEFSKGNDVATITPPDSPAFVPDHVMKRDVMNIISRGFQRQYSEILVRRLPPAPLPLLAEVLECSGILGCPLVRVTQPGRNAEAVTVTPSLYNSETVEYEFDFHAARSLSMASANEQAFLEMVGLFNS